MSTPSSMSANTTSFSSPSCVRWSPKLSSVFSQKGIMLLANLAVESSHLCEFTPVAGGRKIECGAS